jgi:hypothetical protein
MKPSQFPLLIFVLLLCTEFAVRMSGAVDFATYHVDDEIGYIPNPNQSGSFLDHHTWVFNDRSMGTATPWNPKERPNLLLIGNSIVMAGILMIRGTNWALQYAPAQPKRIVSARASKMAAAAEVAAVVAPYWPPKVRK